MVPIDPPPFLGAVSCHTVGDALTSQVPYAALNRSDVVVTASSESVDYALLELGADFGNNGGRRAPAPPAQFSASTVQNAAALIYSNTHAEAFTWFTLQKWVLNFLLFLLGNIQPVSHIFFEF